LLSLLLPRPETSSAAEVSNMRGSVVDRVIERATTLAVKGGEPAEDMLVETLLTTMLKELRSVTKDESLALPHFEDSPEVVSGKVVKIAHARSQIIVAQELVDISFAHDCLIICGGAVEISHGNRNVVIAGHFIHVSHDGGDGLGERMPVKRFGSMLISGSTIDVSHAHGSTMCVAPELVSISHSNGTRFVNSPHRSISHERASTYHEADETVLPRQARANPLATELRVVRAQPPNDAGENAEAVIERDGRALTMRPGDEVEGMPGWRLLYVERSFVLFRSDDEFAGFAVPRR
jgi:hypothetical protein